LKIGSTSLLNDTYALSISSGEWVSYTVSYTVPSSAAFLGQPLTLQFSAEGGSSSAQVALDNIQVVVTTVISLSGLKSILNSTAEGFRPTALSVTLPGDAGLEYQFEMGEASNGISLDFITVDPAGVLFYSGPDNTAAVAAAAKNESADHIAIYLMLGQLWLDIQSQVGNVSNILIHLGPIVADGQWHNVQATRNSTIVTFQVDSLEVKVLQVAASTLSLSGRVFIGGIVSGEPYVPSEIDSVGQMVGSFDDVIVDGQSLTPSYAGFTESFGLVTISVPPTFLGLSSMTLGTTGISLSTTEFVLSLHFSTSSSEGVLLWVGSSAADYLVLTLVGGSVRMYVELGGTVWTEVTSSGLNDGNTHLAQLQLVSGSFGLTVDTAVPKVINVGTGATFSGPAQFILGGSAVFNGIVLPGFYGCIPTLTYNSNDVFANYGVTASTYVAECS